MTEKLVKLLSTKMGSTTSKSISKSHRSKHNRHQRQDPRLDGQCDDTSLDRDYEDPELCRLRKSIRNNPEGFILNNLMMCVEFFKNYDEEISQMKETLVSPRETTLNNRLLPQKRVLLPDILQEHIADNVTFISRRETVDPTVEPLQPIRIFVVYDNIEVSDEHDSSQYSSMSDTITYNMRLKPSKHKGYVHLQRMGITPPKRNPITEKEVDLSSIAENGGEFFSDGDSAYEPSQFRPLSPRSRVTCTSTLASSKHYDSPNLKQPSCQSRVASTSNVTSSKLTMNKSMQNVLDDESRATSICESRLPVGRNKLSLESLNDYKDDTDYDVMSEFRSIQNQSTLSKRDPESQRRGITRNTRQYSRMKTRSTSASPASSTSSGYKTGNYDSDSEYGYSIAKSYSKSKPLDASEMPESCFCQVTYTLDDRIYDPVEDRKRPIISSKERRVQVERNRRNYDVWYLNSSKFRRRFYNVFVESLALPLDLEEAIKYRGPYYFGSVIYCDKVEVSTSAKCNISESYEITPCVWIQWPECASEWFERSRNSWPSYETIHHIRKSGCYIIPQEFGSKEDNYNYKTEWQLTFPAAERYLETCMNHAQVRVYIIVLMLHKTFIRAVESAPDRLNTYQIRNQLFWLMEKSQSEWVENRTGDYLVKLLKCLCNCINQDEAFLKDYFLQEKNLFKNSEKGSLFFSLKQLKRILENPVMYVLHAMENIRYKSKFFPKLNYEELLRILTAEELLLINPNLEKKVNNFALMQEHLEDDENYNERRGFWDDAKKKKEQFSTSNRKPVTKGTLINPSRAHDSVVDIAIRCGELKGIRLSKLLNFFSEHLIKMATKYHEYGALQQKIEYLHHAMSLTILLAEDEMFKKEAHSHLRQISVLKKLVIHSRSQNEPPKTPERNTEIPNFSASINDYSSITSSVPFSNDEASANLQAEPFQSTKKISDSSIFSCPLKDRHSSISNCSSIPLPDTSTSSSRNSLPQMKKKCNSPVYVRALKDHYSIAPSERSSSSLPVLDERKESDVISQNSCSISMIKINVDEKVDELEEEKDFSKIENIEQKKKDSQVSKVKSLTDEDENFLHDTYI